MKTLIGTSVLAGAVAISTLAAAGLPSSRKVGVFNFTRPTVIAGAMVSGHVVIAHDDAKMARGEACTTVYHYDRKAVTRQGDEIVSFHCRPTARPLATTAQVRSERSISSPDHLLEYQLAGETEGHIVPSR
ncbi:MAG: hypothetical protein ABIS29_11005 [Vicinamibacterales bacterium]